MGGSGAGAKRRQIYVVCIGESFYLTLISSLLPLPSPIPPYPTDEQETLEALQCLHAHPQWHAQDSGH